MMERKIKLGNVSFFLLLSPTVINTLVCSAVMQYVHR